MDQEGSNISPMKKNPRGKFVGSGQKLMIVNFYKNKMALQATGDLPKLTAKEMIKNISEESGIGQRTVSVTLSEYRNKKSVTSPNKTKIRPKVTDKVDEFDQNAIRQKVHQFWHNHQIPTLNKISTAVNEDDSLPRFQKCHCTEF
ncbi:unnamed protein product [Macrosiphum euphorbiae]|uniref:Transposase n=1 Tax=Macrosiphum euphorbiae TaxID=13131 RepID=A0AAV0WRB4_9HEMI|nr:unnamed protein product [Macrosiphum euphorbiae]